MRRIDHIPVAGCRKFFLLALSLALTATLKAQHEWPRSIIGADGGILYVYQPQADSFSGNTLRFKAPVSYFEKGKDTPRYGSFQALALVDIDKDQRRVSVLVANVLMLCISGQPDSAKTDYLKETLECGIPGATIDIPLDELVSSLSLHASMQDQQFARQYKHDPPQIFLATRPSILVLIEGEPRFRRHPLWGVNKMINTPNTIIQSDDGWFYLYGGHHWYIGPSARGPFNYTGYIAPDIQRAQTFIRDAEGDAAMHTDTLREGAGIVENIIVSAPPAELIQTKGEPAFRKIPGTRLRYVANSNNDIFLDTVKRQYYILLSGRWYSAAALDGLWQYVAADALPPDFRRIPEGSPKDNVLAGIAGTDAAKEAIVDALLPQTAVISRAGAKTSVSYDGPPEFADIPGTKLQYALNAGTVVLRQRDQFYCLDKGVWFRAPGPSGPWTVCEETPEEVDLIPPSCPVYFSKYVYIFFATPDYIHTGYTSGYLNAYIDGPTLVYGTGWNYPSWSGNVFYPRPWTWGFGMSYNPWFGWCLGEDLDPGWFSGNMGKKELSAGWWGAASYLPPYIWHHFSGHGLYEQDISRPENITYANNVYRRRRDMVARPVSKPYYTDTIGDVFTQREEGGWLRYEEGQWKKIDLAREIGTLESIERQRKRGEMRIRNFLRQRG
jgi:hypothetical protein